MSKDTACLVDAQLVRLEEDIPPYRKGSRWAQPDVGQAAGYMRRLYEDEEFYQNIADNAKRYVASRLNMERSTGIVKERLENIRKRV